jgi:Glyoxalase-like domain
VIKRLQAVALDCADPVRYAEFYAELLGGRVVMGPDEPDWVEVVGFDGTLLAFQRVDGYRPPTWRGQERPSRSTSTSMWTTSKRTRRGCSRLAAPCSSALTSCAKTPTGGSMPTRQGIHSASAATDVGPTKQRYGAS